MPNSDLKASTTSRSKHLPDLLLFTQNIESAAMRPWSMLCNRGRRMYTKQWSVNCFVGLRAEIATQTNIKTPTMVRQKKNKTPLSHFYHFPATLKQADYVTHRAKCKFFSTISLLSQLSSQSFCPSTTPWKWMAALLYKTNKSRAQWCDKNKRILFLYEPSRAHSSLT